MKMKKIFALVAVAAMMSTNFAYAKEAPKKDVKVEQEQKEEKKEKKFKLFGKDDKDDNKEESKKEESPKEESKKEDTSKDKTSKNDKDDKTSKDEAAKDDNKVEPEDKNSNEEEQAEDEVKKGSIKVHFEKAKEGLKVTIYKVASVIDGEYIIEEDFKDANIDLNKANDAVTLLADIQKLDELAKKGTESKVNANGEAEFKDVEVGVYLVKTEDDPDYDVVQSALVTIPTFDETTQQMSYDIKIDAKTTPREIIDEPKPVPQTSVSRSVFVFAGIALITMLVGTCVGVKKKN